MAYFRMVKEYQLHLIEKIFSKYKISSDFLEVGCGKGDFLKFLDSLSLEGKGIDKSPIAIESVKGLNSKNIKVGNGDIFSENGKYNFILMIDVLEHIKNDKKCLKKIHSLLNENGYFLFQVPSHKLKYCWIDEYYGHYRRYDKEDLQKLVQTTGFTIKEIWCSGFPFISLMEGIISFSGNFFIKNKLKKNKHLMDTYTKKSGIVSPTKEKLGFTEFLFNKLFYIKQIHPLLFKIMDIFLESNHGSTFFIFCQKNN